MFKVSMLNQIVESKGSALRDIWHFLLQLKTRIENHTLPLVSAGVAFYAFLSIFPALASVISIYGLLADPGDVQKHVHGLSQLMPPDVMDIIEKRIQSLSSNHSQSLTLGLIGGLLLSLWSANRAMKALVNALNIAFDVREDRGFIKVNLLTLALTLGSTIVFIVAITAIVVVPIIVSTLLTALVAELLTALLSWSLFVGLLILMFVILYGYGPDVERANWRRLMPGAITAASLFIVASIAFSIYVSNYGQYDQQYGALGAVVVTMMWLFIGAFIFLLGAEVNALKIRRNCRNTNDG